MHTFIGAANIETPALAALRADYGHHAGSSGAAVSYPPGIRLSEVETFFETAIQAAREGLTGTGMHTRWKATGLGSRDKSAQAGFLAWCFVKQRAAEVLRDGEPDPFLVFPASGIPWRIVKAFGPRGLVLLAGLSAGRLDVVGLRSTSEADVLRAAGL